MTGYSKLNPSIPVLKVRYMALVPRVSRCWCSIFLFSDSDTSSGSLHFFSSACIFLQRLKQFQTVRQQTSIERAHGMTLLHNEQGEMLDAEEEHMLTEVRYPHSSLKKKNENPGAESDPVDWNQGG